MPREAFSIDIGKEFYRRNGAAGGLDEPRVQDVRPWRLDKFIIIEEAIQTDDENQTRRDDSIAHQIAAALFLIQALARISAF